MYAALTIILGVLLLTGTVLLILGNRFPKRPETIEEWEFWHS